MGWTDIFKLKAVSLPPSPAPDPAALRPVHLDIPAPYSPFPPPAHAQIFWPDWGDEWRQIWFNRSFQYRRSSLVMSAVKFLGTALCEAPPKLEHLEDGNWVSMPESPYLDLLSSPNPDMSLPDLLKDFAYWWFCYGNVYWFKRRDKLGFVRELCPLKSHLIRPYTIPGSGDFISYYEFQDDESRGVIAPSVIPKDDVIHFRYALDPEDRRVGYSPLDAVILELAADQEAISYSAAVMKNFGVPPFLISPKPDPNGSYSIKAEDLKREAVASQQGGKRGTPMAFSRPVDLTAFGFSPDQMAVDKMRRLPEERVAGVLGIPGMILQFGSFLDRSTYNNNETAYRMAWNGCVIPTLKDIALTLGRCLIHEFYPDTENYWPGFDYSASPAMAEDIDALYQRQTLGFDKGWVKRSEARASVGLPVDEVADDIYKPAPASGGFGFGSFDERETKQLSPSARDLTPPDDLEGLLRWYEMTAPPDARGLLTAQEVE